MQNPKCVFFHKNTFQNLIKNIGQPNTNPFSSKNKVSEATEVGKLLGTECDDLQEGMFGFVTSYRVVERSYGPSWRLKTAPIPFKI